MSVKPPNVKPVIRLHCIKAGQLPVLILRTKNCKQAQQIVSKCLKFLKFCFEDEDEVTFDIVDLSLCSPKILFKFVDTMQDDWNLGHPGRIRYLDAIAELVDYRKWMEHRNRYWGGWLEKGAQKRFQNDAVAVDQRARHQCLRSQGVLGHTVGSRGSLPAALRELAEIIVGETGCCFANRFIFCYQICGYLFIKVKGSLPMTYQYLTMEMVNKAKTNSGFALRKKAHICDQICPNTDRHTWSER